ncbi:FMRFamide receptor, partial [Clonorchis sinensis]
FCFKFLNDYISPIIVLLGIIGNILSIIVLRSPRMRSPVSLYLLSLAVCDIALLMAAGGLFLCNDLGGEPQCHENDTLLAYNCSNSSTSIPFVIEQLLYPLGLTAQMATIWITVCLTAERFIAGCYPLHASILSSIPRARIATLCCVLCAAVYNLPRWFELSYFRDSLTGTIHASSNCEVAVTSVTCLWHTTFRVVYYTWGYILFMFLLPVVALTVMNVKLMQALRRSDVFRSVYPATCYCQAACSSSFGDQATGPVVLCANDESVGRCGCLQICHQHMPRVHPKYSNDHWTGQRCMSQVGSAPHQPWRGTSRRAAKTERNVTRMVVVVVGVFVFCQLPAMVYNIYFGITSQVQPVAGWCVLSEVRNFLVVLNSSINFVIYCCMGAKFRRSFVHVITPCWEKHLVAYPLRSHIYRMVDMKAEVR